jgi:hypothetical protein
MPQLLRVTEAIRAAGLFNYDGLDPFYADRGTAIHKAAEFDDRGTLDEGTVDPVEVAAPLAGWRKFKREAAPEIIGIEVAVEDLRLGFRGTADRRLRIGGREGVLDIKRGKPAAWHAIQVAGYAIGLTGLIVPPATFARWDLYLDGEGGYRLVEHTDPNDYAVFISCVRVAAWKRRKGIDT